MQQLIILRGLPGAGKSTFARKLRERGDDGWFVTSADNFFIVNGEYQYKSNVTKYAHEYCRSQTVQLLLSGRSVIVDNTNTQIWEMEPYLNLKSLFDLDIIITEVYGSFTNIHGVPDSKIQQMKDRWEEITPEILTKYSITACNVEGVKI